MKKMPKIHIHFFRDLPAHEKRLTIPTVLTLLRLFLVPCIIFAMMTQRWGLAFWLFVISTITDSLDGMLARLLNQKTFLGACLDPIADKALLLSVFCTLAFYQSPLFSIPLWFVLSVLIRELIILFGAWIIMLLRGHLNIRPTRLGKMTTMMQMLFIMWLFACYFFNWMPIKTYYSMLGILLILVFLSFIQYLRDGIAQLRGAA